MSLLEAANAAVRFGLEVCALVALAFWGFSVADRLPADILLGVGAPVLFALVWGAFVAPKAPYRLPDPQRLMLEVTAFALVALALVAAGAPLLALLLALAAAVNLALMLVLGQRGQGVI